MLKQFLLASVDDAMNHFMNHPRYESFLPKVIHRISRVIHRLPGSHNTESNAPGPLFSIDLEQPIQ